MVVVTDVDDATPLVGPLWPAVTGTVFPLAANSPEGLHATWQGCATWPTDHLLVVHDDGSLLGACGVLVGDQECRLLAGPLGGPFPLVADAVLVWLRTHHRDVPVSVGVDRGNGEMRAWLRDNHFVVRETSVVTTAPVALAHPGLVHAGLAHVDAGSSVIQHTPMMGTAWAVAHDAAAGDAYWTAERVTADAANWLCLSDPTGSGYVAARVYDTWDGREAEVFVSAGSDETLATCLRGLTPAAAVEGARRIVYLCAPHHVAATQRAGFSATCTYEDRIRKHQD